MTINPICLNLFLGANILNKKELIVFFNEQVQLQMDLSNFSLVPQIPIHVLNHPTIGLIQDVSKEQFDIAQKLLFALEFDDDPLEINASILEYKKNYDRQHKAFDTMMTEASLIHSFRSFSFKKLPGNIFLDIGPSSTFTRSRRSSFDEILSELKQYSANDHLALSSLEASSEPSASAAEAYVGPKSLPSPVVSLNTVVANDSDENTPITRILLPRGPRLHLDEEARKDRRRQKNRESAQSSRIRHKQEFGSLLQERDALRQQVSALERENAQLKTQISSMDPGNSVRDDNPRGRFFG